MYLIKDFKETCPIYELMNVLISAIEAKDQYTKGHSDRVVDVTEWLCNALKLTDYEMKNMLLAAHLHDIGKIFVPDAILNKPTALNDEEWCIIKKHPQYGFDILLNVSHFEPILNTILYHHERWDGMGYPRGISKEEIPLGARILAIADAIDAMLSTRSYRKALSIDACIKELNENAGKQFDPELITIAVKYVLRAASQTA